jgi:hypothetical protein
MPINFDHPKTPPDWLAHWIGSSTLDRLVPSGIRQYALKLGAKERIRSLGWDSSTLRLLVGNQRCIWTLQPDNTWKTSCTCGYPKPPCAHAFLAGYLFETVRKNEEWVNTAPRFNAAMENRHTEIQSTNETSFECPPDSPPKLEVEADFHHRPGSVAVRIYHVEKDMRNLLTMQRIYNLAMRVRYSDNAADKWPSDEREFLKWVAGELKRRPELKQNLKLLNFTPGRFSRWIERWADTTIRLITRAEQREIRTEQGPARIEIHVAEDKDDPMRLGLAAMVVPASGEPVPFPEVFKSMQSGQRDAIVNGRPTEIHSGISWQALCELFGRKNPRIAKDHVEEHLGTVIEGRFDLLRGDPIQFQKRTVVPRINAQADGAETVVSITLENTPIILEPLVAFTSPKQSGKHFDIVHIEPDEKPVLETFLNSLDSRSDDTPGTVRVPGRADAVEKLARAWRNLPETIEKACSPELEPLLDSRTAAPTPELVVNDRGVFLDVALQWRLGNATLPHDAVHAAFTRQNPVVRGDSGRWIFLDPDWAADILETASAGEFGKGARRRMFLPDLQNQLEILKQKNSAAQINARRECLDRILNTTPPPKPECPEHLGDILRPYQHTGFDFLADRLRYSIGTILADDMGLGKTVQALALLHATHNQFANVANSVSPHRPCRCHSLVVCPASVLSVWQNEAERFAPGLRIQLYRGSINERRKILDAGEFDVLLTNYATVRQDAEQLARFPFAIAVLDEAQRIKNPDAQITRAVKQLDIENRIALTGTPLENHPLDLWSIMDFLNPGYLGDKKEFANFANSAGTPGLLARRIAPVMLRRTKKMVAPELPERIEETITVEMEDDQRRFYDRLLKTGTADLSGKDTMEILALLTRLRQTACAPELVPGGEGVPSAKLDTCLDMIAELVDEGHSVLVFSQFVKMLDLIDNRLEHENIPAWRITGDTPVDDRAGIVRDFSDAPDAGVMLLSLRAAGTGLTLTKADYVILVDPWWNPAVENQAIDRTHRIGQKQTVVAYRLVVSGTVEESVRRLQAAKRELFDTVVDGASTDTPSKLSRDTLEQILLESVTAS